MYCDQNLFHLPLHDFNFRKKKSLEFTRNQQSGKGSAWVAG